MASRTIAAVAAIALLAGASIGHAAESLSARLTLDNDQFNFWESPGQRPDFGYTHGTEIALRVPRAGRPLARLVPRVLLESREPGGEAALELRLRQNIYSPWSFPTDRPYAGWLEGAVGASRAGPRTRREVLLHVGVTGPPSQSGAVQRSIHRRFFKQGEPPDWSHQLPFEPGIGIETNAAWLLRSSGADLRGRESDTSSQEARPDRSPAWTARLGMLARIRAGTYAVDFRLGLAAIAGLAPPGLWEGGAGRSRGLSLYGRLNPHLDIIARDEFLDGTLFRSSPGPGARVLVPESEAAVGAGWGRVVLEWTVLRRAREFDSQPTPHTYASLALRWMP